MFCVSRLRLQPVLVMEERELTFEGYLEKVNDRRLKVAACGR